jgi:multidrug efflux pump subunit AcrA (membrane-fusion protein)
VLRSRRFWIIITVVLILLAAGATIYYDQVYLPNQETVEEPELQTAVARQGDLVVSASGAGSVIPATEVNLGFQSVGILEELLVKVGDHVFTEDALARLDDTSAQQSLANAELQLAQTKIQTDPESTSVGTSLNAISIEQAQINLENAQAVLDDLTNWQPDDDEIAKAEAAVVAAEASVEAARGQEASKSYSNQVSRLNLEQAERDLATAQENYDAAWDEARDWETFYDVPICEPGEREPCTGQTWAQRVDRDRESAANALTRAQDTLNIAQANYNSAVSGSSNSSSASAESGLLNTQIALEAAGSGPTEEQIEAAETAVRQAELALQQVRLNEELAKISLVQAELNLQNAQEELDKTVLLSPLDGTVMAINAEVGEIVGSSPFVTLADLEQPLLEIFLDESDLDKIGIDFEVEVIFDALPDDTFIGHVIRIDPTVAQLSGVPTIRGIVQLDEASFNKPQTLPIGLNATVDVIGGRAEGAVLVPVEALRELSPGQFALFVLENGEPRLRPVEVGLMDFTFAEIVDGLEAGEIVTTGIVETN